MRQKPLHWLAWLMIGCGFSAIAQELPPNATLPPAVATEPALHLYLEADPLPFIYSGYGIMLALSPRRLPNWRFAMASFALDVPDFVVNLKSSDRGFHLRVDPSLAFYALRYFSPDRRGFALGGSARFLRQVLTHDAAPGERVRLNQLSLEAIVAWNWHPFPESGFYLQPWASLAIPIHDATDVRIAGNAYSGLGIQPFATVNIGWEFEVR